jgi:uncharacterized membrane protein YpjA
MMAIKRLMANPWFIAMLVLSNLAGTAYGYYYYQDDLVNAADYLFRPDCPHYTLLMAVCSILIYSKRSVKWLNALTAFGLMKYGAWTVFVLSVFPDRFVMVEPLLALHMGMALEGVLLLGYLPEKWYPYLGLIGWMFLNDVMDYGYGYHPSMTLYGEDLMMVEAFTFLESAIITSFIILKGLRKRRNR